MTYYVEDKSRVGRSTYWMYYIGIAIGSVALYGWSIYELISMNFVPAIFGFIIPSILSIYFRVIAMRRCRDIGWPAFLPWVSMGLTMLCGAINGANAALNPTQALGVISASMIVAVLVGLADFVFLIVIGCLESADGGYADAFGGAPYEPDDLPDTPHGYVDVMGRKAVPARPARPIPKSYGEDQTPAPATPQPAIAPAVRGFGRRVV